MGQGGYLVLCNATQYDWKRTYQHSYQMNAWDFPAVIPAYTSASVYVEFDEDITKDPFDDAGEANYEIVREAFPPMTMKFQFAVTFRNLLMRLLDNEPGVKLVNAAISPKTAAPGSVGAPRFEIDLGWRHNDSVVFVLAARSELQFQYIITG